MKYLYNKLNNFLYNNYFPKKVFVVFLRIKFRYTENFGRVIVNTFAIC